MDYVGKSYSILAYSTAMDNVLFVTIDSLRALKFLTEDTQKHLTSFDRLLRDGGVSFSNAFATGPMTKTSFPGLLYGSYALDITSYPQMETNGLSLASSLRDCGITTAGFTSNPFLSREFDYNDGFDYFRDYQSVLSRKSARLFPRGIERAGGVVEQIDNWLPVTTLMKKLYEMASGRSRPYVSATRIVDDTIEFLSTEQSPFFCWTHFMDVHHPCFPPQSYRDRHGIAPDITATDVSDMYSKFVGDADSLSEEQLLTLRQLYRAAIDYVDDEVNRLLDEIAASGRLENTLVIITSDHGELFGEHGEYSKQARLYDELLQVPLVFSRSLSLSPTDLVSLIDLPPLVHEVVDCPAPPAYDGRSPLSNPSRNRILFEHIHDGHPIVGARSDQWKYVIDDIRNEERLVELSTGQINHTPQDLTDDAKKVREVAKNHFNNIPSVEEEIVVSDNVRERLTELGYLDDN